MKLSCVDFSWPNLRHQFVLDLIAELGFEAVDIGLISGYSPITPEMVRQDIPMWAGILHERISSRGLTIADVFGIPSLDYARLAVNTRDPAESAQSAAFFRDLLDLTVRLGCSGMTILPGTIHEHEPWQQAVDRSARELRWRVEEAAARGVRLSVEPHVGSNVDTPEKVSYLLERVPGLELTLDYAHFTMQGIPDAAVEPLLERARHFHCRGCVEGKVQARFRHNTIDFGRIVSHMREIGYDGYIAMEYEHSEEPGCGDCDVLQEVILFRDFLRAVPTR